MEHYLADKNPPVCSLNVAQAWSALTSQEKLYAHWMSAASWAGARIIMAQTSPHGPSLFDLIVSTFSAAPGKFVDLAKLKQESAVSDDEWHDTLSYCAQVLSNLANIKSFGATKFVPRVPREAFEKVVKASPNSKAALSYWDKVKDEIYALEPEPLLTIGKRCDGHLSNYYPSELAPSDDEVSETQALCDAAGVSTLNTRLTKEAEGKLTLLVASAASDSLAPSYPPELKSSDGKTVLKIQAGDFAHELTAVNAALTQAEKHAGDDNRAAMLRDYAESFKTGDIEKHKDGSRKWVKDVGPVVESYIGFIESYVDPYGARAEWEGFTAIVDKEQSRKFNTLVDAAPHLITDLPWGKQFEVPEFKRPDFTALLITSFATGGIPAGINIPNYHDVREKDGFKNVSLANILAAKAAGEEITFIAPEERDAYEHNDREAFEVQVACHELLGHGTGRLLQESADGSLNFDPKTLINPLTGKPVQSWYKPGETYGSRIGPVSPSMEECRAEAVALYMASNAEIAGIFGFDSQAKINELIYWTFVIMARAGIRALEWFDPKTGKHGQAHMEARLGITNWMMKHGIVTFEEVRAKDGSLEDVYVRIDRKTVVEKGKDVMGKLLLEIQVRKSTGDGPGATEFYKKLTTPEPKWVSEYRPLVLKKKLPRKVFVQPVTHATADSVEMQEFPVTLEGVIESFVVRNI